VAAITNRSIIHLESNDSTAAVLCGVSPNNLVTSKNVAADTAKAIATDLLHITTTLLFQLDEPSGVVNQPTHVTIDSVPATMFYGSNSIMGDTREIWFINAGLLYEVTTFKQLDTWLVPILQTWHFTP
jgi:hypothetical protein